MISEEFFAFTRRFEAKILAQAEEYAHDVWNEYNIANSMQHRNKKPDIFPILKQKTKAAAKKELFTRVYFDDFINLDSDYLLFFDSNLYFLATLWVQDIYKLESTFTQVNTQHE